MQNEKSGSDCEFRKKSGPNRESKLRLYFVKRSTKICFANFSSALDEIDINKTVFDNLVKVFQCSNAIYLPKRGMIDFSILQRTCYKECQQIFISI